MKKKLQKKTLLLSFNIHNELKEEAIKAKKQLHAGFGDDIVVMGIREYRRLKKTADIVN